VAPASGRQQLTPNAPEHPWKNPEENDPMANGMQDVVIMGGGLAGLTLALQLRQRLPDLRVLVLERQAHPVPQAAWKVGESSVEIGAHYFSDVLGLREHLESAHLRKFGFRFFCSEGRTDLDRVAEIGASRYFSVPSYQIDRGIFENHLGDEARRRGVNFVDGATITDFDLDGASATAPHHVAWRDAAGKTHSADCRWLVDASGRAGLIKRRLDLQQPNDHRCHAIWFRIADRLHVDDWADDPAWRSRCTPPARWQSTNHLVGEGYWVWLIPLSSGSHSIGIVADPDYHPLSRMDSFDRAMDWLAEHQPLLHAQLSTRRHLLQDFASFRRFSYGCKQVFSGDRWALTGEAGLFLDPFYSPGSDFIAIANTYITDLVARDLDGERIASRATIYDQTYQSFYESTLTLYQGQYGIFGHPDVLAMKIIWDYTYYWGVLSQIYFGERLTDLRMLGSLRPQLDHCRQLNQQMQTLLRAWAAAQPATDGGPVMHDQAALPWFAELNRRLTEHTGDETFRARMAEAASLLHRLAGELLEKALAAGVAAEATDPVAGLLSTAAPSLATQATASPQDQPLPTAQLLPA